MTKFDEALEPFSRFDEEIKKYQENTPFDKLGSQHVKFDVKQIQLDNMKNIDEVLFEISEVPTRIFVYGSICEAQNRIVQQLEDEFDRWKATVIVENKLDEKTYKTDKAKDRYLITTHTVLHSSYLEKLNSERFKLAMLKRIVSSLENYSYKLHAIKEYIVAKERT